ncbi:hypothetical protein PHYNN_230 [Pantoea phage Phynn]|nr:hypothetical protein PHYNN_230 [Pantoea phage Phynn]
MTTSSNFLTKEEISSVRTAAHDLYCALPYPRTMDIQEPSPDSRGVCIEDAKKMTIHISYEGDTANQYLHKSEIVAKYLAVVNPGMVKMLLQEIDRLRGIESLAKHWEANHATEVHRSRMLKERPDMPLERVSAYDRMVALEEENKSLRAQVDSLSDRSTERNMLSMMYATSLETSSKIYAIEERMRRVFRD